MKKTTLKSEHYNSSSQKNDHSHSNAHAVTQAKTATSTNFDHRKEYATLSRLQEIANNSSSVTQLSSKRGTKINLAALHGGNPSAPPQQQQPLNFRTAVNNNAAATSSTPASVVTAQAPATIQYVWAVISKTGGGKHYHDGWGESYGITNDTALQTRVSQDGNYGNLGSRHSIDLDDCLNKKTKVTSRCNILYSNTQQGNIFTTTIFHCGPTST